MWIYGLIIAGAIKTGLEWVLSHAWIAEIVLLAFVVLNLAAGFVGGLMVARRFAK